MTSEQVRQVLSERLLANFSSKFGAEWVALASHAALPVAIDVHLLHLIRLNFFSGLPYTAESDLLLSPLCAAIGDDLYEIDPNTRSLLLQKLFENYSTTHINRLAALLWDYSAAEETIANEHLARAQQLTALSFLAPQQALTWLQEAEASEREGRYTAVGSRDWFVAMHAELRLQEQSREQAERTAGAGQADDAQSFTDRAEELRSQGELKEARGYLILALSIREEQQGPKHLDTAHSLYNLASLLQEMGDYEAAQSYYERALAIYNEQLGPDHPDAVKIQNNLRELLQEKAKVLADEGDHLQSAEFWFEAGILEQAAREFELAGKWLEAANLWRDLDQDGKRANAYENYARSLTDQAVDDEEKALAWEQAARAYADSGQVDERLQCEHESARYRHQPIITLEIEQEAFTINVWSRLIYTVRNYGFGIARFVIVTMSDERFDRAVEDEKRTPTLTPGKEFSHWFDIRPRVQGSNVSLQLFVEYVDKSDIVTRTEHTVYLQIAGETVGVSDTGVATSPDLTRKQSNEVTHFIDDHYTLDELRELGFELDVDFDNLERINKVERTRTLIGHLERSGRFDDLYIELAWERPQAYLATFLRSDLPPDQQDQVIEFYLQSLKKAPESGDRPAEAIRLEDLGKACLNIGATHKAISFFQQALNIARDSGDRRAELAELSYLGDAYIDLGEIEKAINYYQHALSIAREIGDRRAEATGLSFLKKAHAVLREVSVVIDRYNKFLRDLEDKKIGSSADIDRAQEELRSIKSRAMLLRRGLSEESGGQNLDNIMAAADGNMYQLENLRSEVAENEQVAQLVQTLNAIVESFQAKPINSYAELNRARITLKEHQKLVRNDQKRIKKGSRNWQTLAELDDAISGLLRQLG